MYTLIIDGDWLLKKNYTSPHRSKLFLRGEFVGGSFGFLESLRKVANSRFPEYPDRIVVMWDGIAGGKMRHDFYPSYKKRQ